MISKNQIKFIKSLENKKVRYREGLFIAEGPKVVGDLLAEGFKPHTLVAVEGWSYNYKGIAINADFVVTEEELRKVSFLQHPQQVIGVFPIPTNSIEHIDTSNNLVLALDDVQDPGNLGTIIRIADWFGISNILCSEKTADAYNPKVVQATMGSIARVELHYVDLPQFIASHADKVPVYGTFLDGKNIYSNELSANGIIVMGNEGNGISNEIAKQINRRLFIPYYPENRHTAESLNVAIATAITCAELRRRRLSMKN